MDEDLADDVNDPRLRRVVLVVALLNLAYFGVEFAVASAIGSVSLFADSVDFLEDASVNLLILMALAWSVKNRARLGMALAALLLVPGVATLWTAWRSSPRRPRQIRRRCRWPASALWPSTWAAPSCWRAIVTTAAA